MKTSRHLENSTLPIPPARFRGRLLAAFSLLLLCFHLVRPREESGQESASEYQVKAAYLFNFLKFVEWPDDAFTDSLAPIVIGIAGDDPFGESLPQVIVGKTVQSRDLVIRKYRAGETPRGCQILFINASEKKRLPQWLAGLRGSSTLLVSDMDGFLNEGGMIQFVPENNRVRFAINVDATGRARLKISSKLLSLAKVEGISAVR